MARSSILSGDARLSDPIFPDAPAENTVEAFISELTGAREGARPFVSLVVRYSGREARLQIESAPGAIEHTALPEAVRKELACLIDALESMSEGETPITVRLTPIKPAP